jgi:hypothetical protein
LIRFRGGFCRWFGIFGFYSPSRLFSNNSWHRGLKFWFESRLKFDWFERTIDKIWLIFFYNFFFL